MSFISAASADHDERPGPGWISIEQAIKTLHDAGYGTIAKIEAEDGHWTAKAMKGGAEYKVEMDPKTGRIATIKEKHDD